jgi:hypothetical protein
LIVVILLLPTLACTRLPEESIQGVGVLATERLLTSDSIPSDWGKLVSVSVTPLYNDLSYLWFQDENGKVRMIVYHIRTRQLSPDVVVIPRR